MKEVASCRYMSTVLFASDCTSMDLPVVNQILKSLFAKIVK